MAAFVPLAGFVPDADPTTPGILLQCDGWIPNSRGMRTAYTLTDAGYDALPAACTGYYFSRLNDGTAKCYAGTAAGLYELSGVNWTDRDGGATYVSGINWRFATLGNVTYASLGNVNLQVLDLMIKTADLKPRQLPVSNILAQRKAEILKVIPSWENAEKSGIFAENFFPDHPIDLLKKDYAALWTKAGKIISIKEMIPENQLRGRFIIEGENANIEVFFTLSPENPPLIQQLDVREVPKK